MSEKERAARKRHDERYLLSLVVRERRHRLRLVLTGEREGEFLARGAEHPVVNDVGTGGGLGHDVRRAEENCTVLGWRRAEEQEVA